MHKCIRYNNKIYLENSVGIGEHPQDIQKR